MEHQMPVLEQINIVTGNSARSRDFYSRLGVKFPSLGDDPAGDHFHANGETSNRLRLELDSAAFARVWNQGWSANPDLQGRIVLGFTLSFVAQAPRPHTRDDEYRDLFAIQTMHYLHPRPRSDMVVKPAFMMSTEELRQVRAAEIGHERQLQRGRPTLRLIKGRK